MMQTLSVRYPVQQLCALLGVASSSYYYQAAGDDDLALLSRIEDVLADYPTYGYRRVTVELGRRGPVVNDKRVLRVMHANELIQAMRHSVRTTDSRHGYPRYANLVKGLTIERPDQVWCADITYIRLERQFAYLAILLDVFTRSIRGWALGMYLDSALALRPLRRALQHAQPAIHHSDQGIQYAASGYVAQLAACGVQVSMARAGQPRENAYAERVIRTIKEEEVYLNGYQDLAEARENVGALIDDVYQTKRIHSALGYLTPVEFEAQWRRQKAQAEAGQP
jgi:transposase InsO family protein